MKSLPYLTLNKVVTKADSQNNGSMIASRQEYYLCRTILSQWIKNTSLPPKEPAFISFIMSNKIQIRGQNLKIKQDRVKVQTYNNVIHFELDRSGFTSRTSQKVLQFEVKTKKKRKKTRIFKKKGKMLEFVAHFCIRHDKI